MTRKGTARHERNSPKAPGGRRLRLGHYVLFVTIALFAAGAALLWSSGRSRPVTYYKNVAPIVLNHCAGCHHPGESAPFSLQDYAEVKRRGKQIVDVTSRRVMPPWLLEPGVGGDFVGQRVLTDAERETLRRWVAQGSPAGNPSDAPPTPQWPSGWKLGKPDLVMQLPTPYLLTANGVDVYRNFVLPIPTTARRYVRAVELAPGNARVVHHAFMRIDPTRESARKDAMDPEPGFAGLHTPATAQPPAGQFLSWQPGKIASAEPEELAWVLEKGCDLVLQMHLRPSGKPETVQPSVAFYFTERPPTKTPFKFGLMTYDINIPAGTQDYSVKQRYQLPVDVDVLKVLPHAHYLARTMDATARLPDGSSRPLFRIANWDFNWQGDYAYQTPVFLPKGTSISIAYTYDNSTNNARNPHHPPQPVRYGINSSDEMAELWLQVLPRRAEDLAVLEKDNAPITYQRALAYNDYLLRQDPNNARAHVEQGKAYLFLNRANEARASLRRALELRNDDDEPHYFLGLLHRLQGDLVTAQSEFDAAIAINPENAKAHGNLGLVLVQQGRLEEAAERFRTALRLNPDDTIARQNLERLRQK